METEIPPAVCRGNFCWAAIGCAEQCPQVADKTWMDYPQVSRKIFRFPLEPSADWE